MDLSLSVFKQTPVIPSGSQRRVILSKVFGAWNKVGVWINYVHSLVDYRKWGAAWKGVNRPDSFKGKGSFQISSLFLRNMSTSIYQTIWNYHFVGQTWPNIGNSSWLSLTYKLTHFSWSIKDMNQRSVGLKQTDAL